MNKNKPQNSYSKLLSNTIIFAIGSFSSKILAFLMISIYTNVLEPKELGKVDNMIQLANLLIPLATLSISESIIRYGLDRKYNKSTVFTTGILINLGGMLIFALLMPLISMTKYVKGWGVYILIYVITASVKMVVCEFVRARGLVKLYAFNGLLTTFTMILFNILFLIVFKMGITGYISAIITSDLISIIFIFIIADIRKFFSIKLFDKAVAKQMLAFSIPLIPTTIMWWITNVSDRFLVQHFLGLQSNGYYAVSYKIPTIITTIYGMFSAAWNMSAITENESKNKSKFYSNVFNTNQALVFLVSSLIMLLIIPITKVLVSKEYFISYKYTPILLIAAVFTCFSSFFGSIYAAEKKTKHSLVTSALGAGLNISLNLILIPSIGINGASLATFASYLLVFVLRAVDVKKISGTKIYIRKTIYSTIFLAIMTVATLYLDALIMISVTIPCFIFVVLINFKQLRKGLRKVLPKKIANHIPLIRERR